MLNPFIYAAAFAANEVLHLDFEGANGSTTIIDSTGRHSPTAYNGASISTAWASAGSSSLYLPSVSLDDYVQIDGVANSDFIHGGNFSYKFVVKMTSLYTRYTIFMNVASLGGGFDTTTQRFAVLVDGTTGQVLVKHSATLMYGTNVAIGVPQTIELQRVGNTISLIQNGVTTATIASTTVWGAGFLSLGGNGGSSVLRGYIDQFVVTKN